MDTEEATEETVAEGSEGKRAGRDINNDNRTNVTVAFPLSKLTLGRGDGPSADDFAALAGLVAQLAAACADASGDTQAATEMREVAERAAVLAGGPAER